MIFGIPILSFIMLICMDIAEIYCFHLLLSRFFKRRNWTLYPRYRYFLFLCLFFVIMLALNIPGLVWLNMASFIAILLSMLFALYEAPAIRGCSYLVIFFVGNMLVEGITARFLRSASFRVTDYSVLGSPFASILMILMKLAITVTICHFAKKDADPGQNRTFFTFLLIPVASGVMVICNLYFTAEYDMASPLFVALVASSIALVVGNALVFYAFEKFAQTNRNEFILRAQSMKAEADNDILAVATKNMQRRLRDAEQNMEKDRVMRHDRRHFEGMVLTLIREGDVAEAERLLSERLAAEPQRARKWCENTAVNATMDYYLKLAEKNEIKLIVEADIPSTLPVDDLEFAITVGNLLENAIHGNLKVDPENRFIKMRAVRRRQLLITIENACPAGTKLDKNHLPFTAEKDHGIGTKSVLAFAAKTGTEIFYNIDEGRFIVRMMLPAESGSADEVKK